MRVMVDEASSVATESLLETCEEEVQAGADPQLTTAANTVETIEAESIATTIGGQA